MAAETKLVEEIQQKQPNRIAWADGLMEYNSRARINALLSTPQNPKTACVMFWVRKWKWIIQYMTNLRIAGKAINTLGFFQNYLPKWSCFSIFFLFPVHVDIGASRLVHVNKVLVHYVRFKQNWAEPKLLYSNNGSSFHYLKSLIASQMKGHFVST